MKVPLMLIPNMDFPVKKLGTIPNYSKKEPGPFSLLFLGNRFFFLYNLDSNIYPGVTLESVP